MTEEKLTFSEVKVTIIIGLVIYFVSIIFITAFYGYKQYWKKTNTMEQLEELGAARFKNFEDVTFAEIKRNQSDIYLLLKGRVMHDTLEVIANVSILDYEEFTQSLEKRKQLKTIMVKRAENGYLYLSKFNFTSFFDKLGYNLSYKWISQKVENYRYALLFSQWLITFYLFILFGILFFIFRWLGFSSKDIEEMFDGV